MTFKQSFLHLQDVDITHKKLLFRNDFNVPVVDGVITDDTRLVSALPSISYALQKQASVMLMSHFGRPKENPSPQAREAYSLKPVARHLEHLLKQPVIFIEDLHDLPAIQPGQVALLENVRFLQGETHNDAQLAQYMASLCDVYVMDAFATAHRKHASTCGVMQHTKLACAGFLLAQELEAIGEFTEDPKHPVIAIVGGSKVSTKLGLLSALAQQVDRLIVGGGILNTFIAAAGYKVGKSLYEPKLISQAQSIANLVEVPLPKTVIVAEACSAKASRSIKKLEQIEEDDMILDVSVGFVEHLIDQFKQAKTILWNGPLGVFEIEQFSYGTAALAQLIAHSPGFSLAGGGDTLAAIKKFDVADRIDYLSTGGGAFLELIENKSLPVLEGLQRFKNKV